MLPELIADLGGRKGGDLDPHELPDTSDAVFQLFIDCVKGTGAHGETGSSSRSHALSAWHKRLRIS